MFGKRSRSQLHSVIFTDGRIVSTSRDGDSMHLVFRDYAGSELRIELSGVTSCELSPQAYVYDVMNTQLHEQGDGWLLRLGDDDDELLLALAFRDAEVAYIT